MSSNKHEAHASKANGVEPAQVQHADDSILAQRAEPRTSQGNDPRVLLVEERSGHKPYSWPEKGGPAQRCRVVLLSDALAPDGCGTQECAYLVQHAPRGIENEPADVSYRLNTDAVDHVAVTMQLLLTDIDARAKRDPAFDAAQWWAAQQPAIEAFRAAYPGAFVAQSRGGLRIYQRLATPIVLRNRTDAAAWSARYLAWVDHVDSFGWDDAKVDVTKDWTRLQRIAHDVREGVRQALPTIGDRFNVGVVELPASADAGALAVASSGERLARPSDNPDWLPFTWDSATAVVRAAVKADETNLVFGGFGRVLFSEGFEPDAARATCERLCSETGANLRHVDSAVRAAVPNSGAWGWPKLSERGLVRTPRPTDPDMDALWDAVNGRPASVIERLHPNTLRRNPDDRACPWWLYAVERGVWEPVSDHAVASWVDRVDIPEARGSIPKTHVRNRNAVINQHQLELRGPQDAGDVLALPDGTLVELRTGLRRATRPEDHCTATAGCVPDATTSADAEGVMLAWCDGDAELAAYLWRSLGHMLTGEIREKQFWVLYGVSNTGKTSFAEVVAHMMAGHHVRVPVETWLSSRTGQVSSSTQDSLRRTIGARLVTSAELPARPFDTGLVKTFTGGDRLTAAGKWKAEVSFSPRAKLVICGNNPPETAGYDEAFVKRLVVVPFTRVFRVTPGYWDAVLVPLLPQFLRRALAEAGAYYRDGLLLAPSAVKVATNDVAEATDTLGAFLDEWSGAPGDFVPASALYEAYLAYAGLTQERYTKTRFGTDVKARLGLTGSKLPKGPGGHGYYGFRRPGQNDELAGVRLTARGAAGRAQS